MLAIDYRTAFDSVEHEFIWHTLKSFNFGPDFIAWVKLLYNQIMLTVTNNGFNSDWFHSARGTFQGSPLSGLLFDLVAEMLANKIRAQNDINGININGNEIKISQYCDDTTYFLQDEESVKKVLMLLSRFKDASGLEINISKTKIMWLGSLRHKRDSVNGIEAVTKAKILGIIFSATEDCKEENINPVIQKIKTVTTNWAQRSLTIKGRITVAKSLLVSQIVYVSLAAKIANVDLETIQSHILKFLWRGRPPKVAFSTICQDISDGGLKATDVCKLYESLRMTWIKRLYTEKEAPWNKLLQSRLHGYSINDLLKNRNAKKFVEKANIPSFYKEIILSFQKIFPSCVENAETARLQSLWNNDKIKVEGKPIFLRSCYRDGIKVIDDLIAPNGNVMSFTQVCEKYPHTGLNFLTFQSLKNAIPSAWKDLIRADPNNRLTDEQKKCCIAKLPNDKEICIRLLRSYHVYQKLIVKKNANSTTKMGK